MIKKVDNFWAMYRTLKIPRFFFCLEVYFILSIFMVRLEILKSFQSYIL